MVGSDALTPVVWQFNMLKNISYLQNAVSALFTLVFLLVSAWMLGEMVWMVKADSNTVSSWSTSLGTTKVTEPKLLDISSLRNGALFGEYVESSPVVDTPKLANAPKTRLNLALVGVVSSTDANKNLAVIANKGAQATYGVNEVIEGTRARLKAVFTDRVIIDNTGRDETLMLDGIDYSNLPVAPSNDKPKGARSKSSETLSDEDKLDNIRQVILNNPQELFQYVRLSQVKEENSIVGYRVSPGKDSALFDSVGLQNGDIAIEFNGFDLTKPDVMTELASALVDMTEINLSVLRDGQQHDIYIPL